MPWLLSSFYLWGLLLICVRHVSVAFVGPERLALEAVFLDLLDVAEGVANGSRSQALRLQATSSLPTFDRHYVYSPSLRQALAGQMSQFGRCDSSFAHFA